jgi:hypothetical protein
MGIKQCAGCGSQMASTARECPVCGRGSMTSDVGMIAFLVVLLLGIGLASGLIPISQSAPQPEPAPMQLATPPRLAKPHATNPSNTSQVTRPTPAAADSRPHVPVRAKVAKAPCATADTSGALVPCEESAGYKSASPDSAPPETSAVRPSSAEPRFYTAYDSIGH